MIRKKITKLCFIILLCTSCNLYARDTPINLIQQKQNSDLLIKLWDSINYSSDYILDPYQINTWEFKFEQEYNTAIKKKETELAFKLSIPLSYIYHSETKFKKGLPLLQNIYKERNKLSKIQLREVLIKNGFQLKSLDKLKKIN